VARLSKDSESVEKLKRVLAADNRLRDREAEPTLSQTLVGGRGRDLQPGSANGLTGSASRAAQLRCGTSNPFVNEYLSLGEGVGAVSQLRAGALGRCLRRRDRR
jgi:hypothetical protein